MTGACGYRGRSPHGGQESEKKRGQDPKRPTPPHKGSLFYRSTKMEAELLRHWA